MLRSVFRQSRAIATGSRRFSAKADLLAPHDVFLPRHIGPSSTPDVSKMCNVLGVKTIDELIDKTVPQSIRLKHPLGLDAPKGEHEALSELKEIMGKNTIARTHLGMGYYGTLTPPVILRNVLENPAWYTAYTPYQPEISQGRLEMLLNYQTMIIDLCGLPVANASLLDEGTSAAEAMHMLTQAKRPVYLVADSVHPQTIAVVKTRAEPYGIEVRVAPVEEFSADACSKASAVLIQYPATDGSVQDYSGLCQTAHANGAKVVCASDLLALTQLTPPGEWGADVVVGNSQRFGVPMGFGGPHAAFFCTSAPYQRKLPGRVIGVSIDIDKKQALRMAMQTREQHIRRESATSNICTAQALLANVAASYAVYHGPEGLKRIGAKVHAMAVVFANAMQQLGYTIGSKVFFDTVRVNTNSREGHAAFLACHSQNINIRLLESLYVTVAFDETTTIAHVNQLVQIFAAVKNKKIQFDASKAIEGADLSFPKEFERKSKFMEHPVFHMYHSETDMLRYLYSLQQKDLSLATAMIPLGSCTMKLNATSEMIPITWPEVGGLHPFAPSNQTQGYKEMIEGMERDLATITGFAAVSLQPNSGANGEYTGLLAVRNYHRSRGDFKRNIALIPTSAHGTNPASAAMCGMKIVQVKCDSHGEIDVPLLKEQLQKYKDEVAVFMVTYPSTHGVFEENIRDIVKSVHDIGAMVYMDGANMNAQVGLCSPGDIGADVCHLNLHKTFCIPHGGGGPGMGPIGVTKALAPFLPGHPIVQMGGSTGPVCSAPWSSASILPISWMYLRMMGGSGLTHATKMAIANANYMAKRLEKHYKILYTGKNGTCAHEFIVDLHEFKAAGLDETDIAKRLHDYNFHSPTMSWPVHGTLMIEPTESEPLYELDRLCDALISIRGEIAEVQAGVADKTDNVLKNAPHTAEQVISDNWSHKYSREKAAYPMAYLRKNKFWPTVGRLNHVYGDTNVFCSCPPIEAYSTSSSTTSS